MKLFFVLGTASLAVLASSGSLPAQEARGAASGSVTEIRVPGRPARARLWTETTADGQDVPYYSLSLDGTHFGAARATSHELLLRYQRFDPLQTSPRLRPELCAPAESRLAIVQYWTQGIEDYREVIRELGGEIQLFLANNSNVVEMSASTRRAVSALPFVRSVTPFHPAYKLEAELLAGIELGRSAPVTVNILTLRRGGQEPIGRWIEQHGGSLVDVSEPTYLMTATLGYSELPRLAARDDVQWIDRWAAPENDMNRARNLHGANFVETQLGVTGQGVRIEVLDAGCDLTHPDIRNFLVHNGNGVSDHGTCTSGIVVGSGSGTSTARGAAPDAFLVIADYEMPYSGGSRYAHTAQLVNPLFPYQCVVQSNSWGSGLTAQYSSISQDLDLILFDFPRISICQSQSNNGDQLSRPQAWAKNVISVGGLFHQDTLTQNDDVWGGGASIGPAADGRIKPDVASFYDAIYCTDRVGGQGYTGGNYYSNFGGTSGATPIVAGMLGLLYEMWHMGVVGNQPSGASVFEDAPNNTTAKALLLNSAEAWSFSGAASDRTRTHQGWGHPDLANLLNSTARMLVVDETDVLSDQQATSYTVNVLGGEPALRVTLVFRDPPGTTSSSLHRINDLDLTVTSPSAVVYHGNNGLLTGLFSAPGGNPNSVDTVENIFVENPEAGAWSVSVSATEVNQDAHVETGAVDVDYALVVSGAKLAPTAPPAAPSGLVGAAVAHRVRLSFVDNANDEDGFELERSLDGVTFLPLATLGADDITHDDPGLTPDTTYHYRVRAFNTLGPSAYSNVVSVHTRKAAPSGPP